FDRMNARSARRFRRHRPPLEPPYTCSRTWQLAGAGGSAAVRWSPGSVVAEVDTERLRAEAKDAGAQRLDDRQIGVRRARAVAPPHEGASGLPVSIGGELIAQRGLADPWFAQNGDHRALPADRDIEPCTTGVAQPPGRRMSIGPGCPTQCYS